MFKTHELTHTREYRTWADVKQRCYNPNATGYRNYGGRGVKMAPEWIDDPAAFVRYMGAKPTRRHQIDRIDPKGHYEPGNVRWVTPKEQGRNRGNRRTTDDDVRFIKFWISRGYGSLEIAKAFGVNCAKISDIKTGRRFGDIQ